MVLRIEPTFCYNKNDMIFRHIKISTLSFHAIFEL